MISIEGIPIVAARLAQAAQDAKNTRRHKHVTVRRGASQGLQLDHARAAHPSAGHGPKRARHVERTAKEAPCELL
jgi:hypothetical protein